MSKNSDLDRLRNVAESATQTDWHPVLVGFPGREVWLVDSELSFICSTQVGDERGERDSVHIATFDPPTVLALINRVQAAEAALASQRGVVKTLAERNVELTKFKDAYSLQAQELEQAEAERDFRQKENKELFEQIERVREVCDSEAYEVSNEHVTYNAVAVDNVLDALDGGEQK